MIETQMVQKSNTGSAKVENISFWVSINNYQRLFNYRILSTVQLICFFGGFSISFYKTL